MLKSLTYNKIWPEYEFINKCNHDRFCRIEFISFRNLEFDCDITKIEWYLIIPKKTIMKNKNSIG